MSFYIIEKGPNNQAELVGSDVMQTDAQKRAHNRLAGMPVELIEQGWTVVVEDGNGVQVWGILEVPGTGIRATIVDSVPNRAEFQFGWNHYHFYLLDDRMVAVRG